MTICTIDVHSRDVVGKLISSKIESVLAFMWQSQLRHRLEELTIKSVGLELLATNTSRIVQGVPSGKIIGWAKLD